MAGKVSLVYYYVPTDQDDVDAPNAFPIAKSRGEIRLKDIREKFPLPGTYHFRFKLKWNDGSAVWMDVTNDESSVPLFEDRIICKILRISWQDEAALAGAGFSGTKKQQASGMANGKPPAQNIDLFDTGASSGGG